MSLRPNGRSEDRGVLLPVSLRGHRESGATVTPIQRFGSALNLNIYCQMLFLNGVYVERADEALRFRWLKAPTRAALTWLAHTLAHRIG